MAKVLGLRGFLEAAGHTLVVTSDKEGADSVFERELSRRRRPSRARRSGRR